MSISVSTAIYQQLGGNKFATMTGAKNFVSGGRDLCFKLPRAAKNKINNVRITLTFDDTYTVEFGRVHNGNYTVISTHTGIYNDALQALFTAETGLNTHL